MEWRCEWCGKPHAENDPPCDNCGHGTFEKAVVRQTDLADDEGPEATTVWVCTECGRTHTKHAPPCSRCGNHKLVKKEQGVDESELSAPGYLDLVTPRYLLGLAFVLGLAGVFVLGVTGLAPIPGFGNPVPTVADVPGNATAAGDISLADAETAYLEAVDDRRREAEVGTLSRDDRLDEIAAFLTQSRVKAEYGDGDGVSGEQFRSLVSDSCDGRVRGAVVTADAATAGSADALGRGLATEALGEGSSEESVGTMPERKTGVDAHAAPDGTVYLTHLVC
jgi:DNA-directed RNA polymerase subunit RPC12/RpoP